MTAAVADASYKISPEMKERVLTTLDGMRAIAKADMMKQSGYITDIVNRYRTRSICGGRHACAVGSLWLAAGERPRTGRYGSPVLLGVGQGRRGSFLTRKPVLRHALHFLNEAADEYMRANAIRGNPEMWRDSVEALFESHSAKLSGDKRRLAMLAVISAAKRKVRAA